MHASLKKLLSAKNLAVYFIPAAVFLAIRLPLLSFPPFGDETMYLRDTALLGISNIAGNAILTAAIFKGAALALGWSWSHLRLAALIFSLATFFPTVLLADELLGYRAAILTAWLMALSPLNVSTSAQLLEQSFVGFFFLLFCLFFIRHLKNGKTWPLVLCGINLGFLFLTYYSAAALLLGFGLYSLATLGFWRTFKIFFIIGIIAAIMFLPYPLLLPEHFHISTLKPGGAMNRLPVLSQFKGQSWLFLSSWFKAAVFTGPLLLWGLICAAARQDLRSKLGLLLSVSLSYMLLLFLLINPDRTMGYWAPIIPLFCILAASVFDSDPTKPMPWGWLTLLVFAYSILLAGLTAAGPKEILSVHPMHYSSQVWLDFFPVRIFYGPSLCLYIRPAAILFAFFGFALFVAAKKWPAFRINALALGLAYGLFYSLSYSHAIMAPDLNKVGRTLLSDLERHPPRLPIYIHGYSAMECAAHRIPVTSFMYSPDVISKITNRILKSGGSIVIADAPAIGADDPLRLFLSRHATLERTFSDDGVVLAEIWTLPPASNANLRDDKE